MLSGKILHFNCGISTAKNIHLQGLLCFQIKVIKISVKSVREKHNTFYHQSTSSRRHKSSHRVYMVPVKIRLVAVLLLCQTFRMWFKISWNSSDSYKYLPWQQYLTSQHRGRTNATCIFIHNTQCYIQHTTIHLCWSQQYETTELSYMQCHMKKRKYIMTETIIYVPGSMALLEGLTKITY